MVVDRELCIVLVLGIKVGFKLGTVLDRELCIALSAIAIISVLVAVISVALEIPIIIIVLVMENITLWRFASTRFNKNQSNNRLDTTSWITPSIVVK
jgi:hypothetical protein